MCIGTEQYYFLPDFKALENLIISKSKKITTLRTEISNSRTQSSEAAHDDVGSNQISSALEIIEGELADLKEKRRFARKIFPQEIKKDGRVVMGCSVDLLNTNTQKIKAIKISSWEIFTKDNLYKNGREKISGSSPIAMALRLKEVGKQIEVEIDGVDTVFEIIKIRY